MTVTGAYTTTSTDARITLTPGRLAAALGIPPPTEEQAAVIAAPGEPGLVTAGAGAGKTETMAARVVWLVASGVVHPERVLGLTFTRKAARQLADRIRARLRRLAGSGLLDELDPSGRRRAAVLSGEPTVLTYHAYAGRLLSEHGLLLPVEPGTRLLPETASWQLAHRVVATWTGDLDTDKVPATITRHVLSLAGELSEHLVSRDAVRTHAERVCAAIETAPRAARQRSELSQELRDIVHAQRLRADLLPLVEAYDRRKRSEGALDFGDQMALAARLASEYDQVVATERERYGAVLLDEYQDTGHAQRVLLRSLFGLGPPVTGAPGSGGPVSGQGDSGVTGRAEAGIAAVRPAGEAACPTPGMPVTAVGDPTQAIYGWRGASAANLPRFTTDFPRQRDGKQVPAGEYGLLTSFRNPARVLELANGVAAPLRANGLAVPELRARDDAEDADINCALLRDVRTEREWVAAELARRWEEHSAEHGGPPTAAVLVRRRADMAPMAEELRARGLPVEVVGLGGLLDEPEVRDLVSALRVLVEPLAGTAAARLLTGARWRLAGADLAALWRRARELAAAGDRQIPGPGAGGQAPPHDPGQDGRPDGEPDRDSAAVSLLATTEPDDVGLVDALDDPGEPDRYSPIGYQRIRRLGTELAALRNRLDQSLPELVADVERTLLLDIESLARPAGAGHEHLDAFADVVTEFAEATPNATVTSFLDYLATAEHAEGGLEPGEVEVSEDRVQVLTVHSAKGLEWRLVAVPHLVREVFPSRRRSGCWTTAVTELPAELRGDAADLPRLALGGPEDPPRDRKEVTEALRQHAEEFAERERTEERRLLYVAITRSEHCLLLSGHWWNETGSRPRGPSDFLTELAELLSAQCGTGFGSAGREPVSGAQAPGDTGLGDVARTATGMAPIARWEIVHWEPEPDADEGNPFLAEQRTAQWPADPIASRRQEVSDGADLVRAALARGAESAAPEENSVEDSTDADADADGDPERWARDTEVLLAERAEAAGRTEQVALPETLSVSQLVDLAGAPEELARRLRRPLPAPPNTVARRGTEFHAWLEHRFSGSRLLELDELPGAADDSAGDERLDELRERFLASEWADRVPYDVEVPFSTEVEGIAVRGRMDAVFADPDGGWTVVDWKTGALPDERRLPAVSVQLAAYRLAWAALADAPVERVRAALHYVRHDRTLRPADLLDADGLRRLVRSLPAGQERR